MPPDLDTICRKCLAKQPRRRYATALELAEDLRRCADGYPIEARTISGAERLGKWTRRNVRSVVLVLLSLWAVVSLLVLHAERERPPSVELQREAMSYRQAVSGLQNDLMRAKQCADAADYLRFFALADRAIGDGDPEHGKELLERCPADQRHWEWYYLRSRLRRQDNPDSVFTSVAPVTSVDLSHDGQYLALGAGGDTADKPQGEKGEVSVWELASRMKVWQVARARADPRGGLQSG